MKTLLIITVLATSGYGQGDISFGYIDFDTDHSCWKAVERLKRQDVGNPNYSFEMVCVPK
jgi:hypothetical protein